jgi:hypothetical protein
MRGVQAGTNLQDGLLPDGILNLALGLHVKGICIAVRDALVGHTRGRSDLQQCSVGLLLSCRLVLEIRQLRQELAEAGRVGFCSLGELGQDLTEAIHVAPITEELEAHHFGLVRGEALLRGAGCCGAWRAAFEVEHVVFANAEGLREDELA